ncbi:MAG: GxxExxY protein [Candidatus Doudnabacteria bacterium]|nr:GxxExxY protein [Candidatus Doudnabacteria bacterium]
MDTEKLIYADLTKQIIGSLFEVHNNLGSGLLEKHYQKALAVEFRQRKINFVEQFPVVLNYKDIQVGKYYLDFFIEEKLVLEIKRDVHFSRANIEQTFKYLEALNLQLGLLVYFGKEGVRFKRIVNLY